MAYTHWVYQYGHCRQVALAASPLTPQPTSSLRQPLASPATTAVVPPCPADPAAIVPNADDRPSANSPIPTEPLDQADLPETPSLHPAYPDPDLAATYALERRIFL